MTSAATNTILSAQSVTKYFGAQPVLDDVSLSIHEGERVGLIGRNGSGKSTLLKILADYMPADDGLVTRRQGLRVGFLTQECELDKTKTVRDVLEEAGQEIRALLTEHEQLSHKLADTSLSQPEHDAMQHRYDDLHHELDLVNAWRYDTEINRVSLALQLPEEDRVLGTLSGGELRRVDLAATLLSEPDVLLLDEPTNHIDTKSVEWIERFLSAYRGSCVLVTHDRYFLELVVTRIVELEFSRVYSFPGNYERFLEYKSQLKEVEAKTEQARQGTLRRELDWIRRGPKARATKQKARIQRFEDLEAEGGPQLHNELLFEIPAPPRLGKRILDVDGLKFSYGDTPIIDNLTFIMQKGMRLGIVGPNGCGKTTLLKLVMGQLDGYKGRITVGDTTEFLYVDQTHEEINPEQSVLDFVSGGGHYAEVNGNRLYVPAYLERMLFDMDTVLSPMRHLSGGERNRVELAKKLLKGGNFLVLDEPTNDLDLPTLRVLEDAILAFDGCTIIVSHDRYFMNRVCTHIIAFDGKGDVAFLTGNYEDYLEYKKEHEVGMEIETKQKSGSGRGKAKNPLRLTYKEREELSNMESTIEAAEIRVAELEEVIQQPGFYEQAHADYQPQLDELEEAKQHAATLYTRWEDLETRSGEK